MDNLSELMWRLETAQKDCVDDGQAAAAILLQDARGLLREQAKRIETLGAALREAERFVSYLANETDGCFAGSGTPTTCLVMIRAALAPEQDK